MDHVCDTLTPGVAETKNGYSIYNVVNRDFNLMREKICCRNPCICEATHRNVTTSTVTRLMDFETPKRDRGIDCFTHLPQCMIDCRYSAGEKFEAPEMISNATTPSLNIFNEPYRDTKAAQKLCLEMGKFVYPKDQMIWTTPVYLHYNAGGEWPDSDDLFLGNLCCTRYTASLTITEEAHMCEPWQYN